MAVVLAEYWFGDKDGISSDWGDLSSTRLSNRHLAEVATRKGLVACLERPSDACGKKSPATLLEAIVGAVYLDSGHNLSSVRKAMIALRFVEVLHDHPSKRKRETLKRVPTSAIRSITLEYGVSNPRETGQLAQNRSCLPHIGLSVAEREHDPSMSTN